MAISLVLFYVFSALALGSATAVILSGNPMRSALFLVLTFFACAGLWLLAQAEFLALVLVLVYVGAVMTLFLFVIMMLNLELPERHFNLFKTLPWIFLILAIFIGLLLKALEHTSLMNDVVLLPVEYSNTHALGLVLYTQYSLAFVAAGVLLLVAILSAIRLAHRAPRACHVQEPSQQMRVDPKTRVRLVKMPAEKNV